MATKKPVKDKYSTTVQELVKRKKEGFEEESKDYNEAKKAPTFLVKKHLPVLKNGVSYEDIVGEPHPDGVERLYPKPFNKWVNGDSIPEADPQYVPDHRVLPDILSGMTHKRNILIVGETGAGKTKDIREMSARLGTPYCRVNGYEGGEFCDLAGGIHIIKGQTEWVDGPIMDVVRNGGTLTIDEWSKFPAGTLMGLQWLGESGLDKEHIIAIAGNHDFFFERKDRKYVDKICTNFTYLQEERYECDGIKFYGVPHQPEFFGWAFNVPRGEKLKVIWDKIPEDTQVLLTHGPPLDILDANREGQHCGCEDLLNRVKELDLKVHAFGHIHEGYGMKEIEGTIYINSSSLNRNYDPVHEPVILDIEF